MPYWYATSVDNAPYGGINTWHLMLLRANSAGESDIIHVTDLPQPSNGGNIMSIQMNLLTNADTGVVVTWSVYPLLLLARPQRVVPKDSLYSPPTYGMAITTGTAVNVVSEATLPQLAPVLQAQDGSFVGSYVDNSNQTDMVAFDASGNFRWTVPNEQPQIATADGGVIGQSGKTYDENGIRRGLPVRSFNHGQGTCIVTQTP